GRRPRRTPNRRKGRRPKPFTEADFQTETLPVRPFLKIALLGGDRSHRLAGPSLRAGQGHSFARPLREAGRGPLGEREGGGVAQVLAGQADVGEAAIVEPRQQGEFASGLSDPQGPREKPPEPGKSRTAGRHERLLPPRCGSEALCGRDRMLIV